jgi:transmembrane sensor
MKNFPTRDELLKMVKKYLSNAITDEERAFLETYYAYFDAEPDELERLQESEAEAIRAEMKAGIDQQIKGRRVRMWPRIAAAAAVLILIAVSSIWLRPTGGDRKSEQLLPLNNGITLTLANGKQVSIDRAAKGELTLPDGSKAKNGSGALDYSDNETVSEQTLTNHTGTTFKLKLSDGTEVYLDVNSSITYPTAFKGSARNVSMTGQAYFKVEHNEKMPFAVQADGETIRDLGTEFNVNNYDLVKVTLVKGALSVRNVKCVYPGAQAYPLKGGIAFRIVDIESTTAWINDKITFNHTPLSDILEQVSRVYGTKIEWEDASLKTLTFGGSLSRTNKLASILNYLRKTGEVNFKVDQNTIQVLKP